MSKRNCYETFMEGQIARTHNPLPGGLYKLEECAARLESCLSEVSRIRDVINKKSDKWGLQRCTSEDKYLWLKGLPNHLAHILSTEVLPGLKALQLDGVATPIIQEALRTTSIQSDCLVQRLETVRRALNSSIENEYQAMRNGGSLIEPLIMDVIQLVQNSLSLKKGTPISP